MDWTTITTSVLPHQALPGVLLPSLLGGVDAFAPEADMLLALPWTFT
jgi:hypothetical protein